MLSLSLLQDDLYIAPIELNKRIKLNLNYAEWTVTSNLTYTSKTTRQPTMRTRSGLNYQSRNIHKLTKAERKTLCASIRILLTDVRGPRGERIFYARKLFHYIEDKCQQLLDEFPKFKRAVMDKLYQLYIDQGLEEAKTWYLNIFGQQMMLEVGQDKLYTSARIDLGGSDHNSRNRFSNLQEENEALRRENDELRREYDELHGRDDERLQKVEKANEELRRLN